MEKGRYLYFSMCRICLFMVRKNSTDQYRSRIGQNTGTSKAEKKVARNPRHNAFVDEYLQGANVKLSNADRLPNKPPYHIRIAHSKIRVNLGRTFGAQ